ncbi:hypothetical protein D9758_011201 [Tetrapyrgos nigripes]|uniref:Aminoglycoside phosphotransferase domain-containing protein n=1 Tax=Tetrapyrgos nigripes TaxID=182062 RepID=A0A8H5FZD6_9AGAR|nr:hypothetical protein D9758_011201 [Tetrapyrgos nigripes]
MQPSICTTYPSKICYDWSFRSTSLLWWLWLKFPPSLRACAYRQLLQRFQVGDKRGPVTRLRFGLYAKIAPSSDEALAVQFVRAHTTIPVPEILDVVPYSPDPSTDTSSWLILSKALPGSPLFQNGTPSRLIHATTEQIANLGEVLSDWIDQLRRIQPPHPQRVCGISGGTFRSHRISDVLVEPFESPAEFHAQFFCTVLDPSADDKIQRLVLERPQKQYKICLTHGDLVPQNILTDDSYCPTGLIDWETAAWMPEYWETTSSIRTHFSRMYIWKDIVNKYFPQYDDDKLLEFHIMKTYAP